MIVTNETIPAFSLLHQVYSWIQSCLDHSLGEDSSNVNFWIAGGAVCSAVQHEKINDFDVFSNSPGLVQDALAQSGHKMTFEIEGRFRNYLVFGHKVQVIHGFPVDSAEDIINMFDYTCVCGAYTPDEFVCHDRFWQDNATKRLVVNGLPYPLSTMERMAKYAKRGFTPCPVGLLALAKAIQGLEVDWDNPEENVLAFYPDGTPRFGGVD